MDSVTIVVPVLGRPQNAEPFMASLEASVDDPPEVLVFTNFDDDVTANAWRDVGAYVQQRLLIPGSFGQKANWAVRSIDTDWMFLCGDDVAFHPGWLEAALTDVPDEVCVIGTNDLANPRVTSGEHAVHFFLRMSYIREQGASWDGPGTVAGPYRHWFTDDELITIAKQRGVWKPCLESVVEHRHPYFAPGVEMDDTYRIGEQHAAADQLLWNQRLNKHAPELLFPVVDLTGY